MLKASLPEPVGEAWFLLAQPVVVGDAAEVHLPHELGVLPDHSCRITYPAHYDYSTYQYLPTNPCPNLWKGRFKLENKLKMLISENERFRQEINADQRHSLFSAHYQLVLDRTKPIPLFRRRKWKLPCQSVFTENKVKIFMSSLYPELIKLLAKNLQ